MMRLDLYQVANVGKKPAFYFVVLSLLFYGYLVAVYPYSFNYELGIGKHQYYLLTYAIAVFTGWFALSVFGKDKLLPGQSLFAGGLILVLSIVFFSEYYSFFNEHFVSLLAIALMVCIFINTDAGTMHWWWVLTGCFYLWQCYLGMDQYFRPGEYDLRRPDGTFRNSGIFSSYLVIQLPVTWYILKTVVFKNRSQWWMITGFSFFLVCTVIIVWTNQSRTAMVALVVILFGMILPLLKRWVLLLKQRIGKRFIAVVAVLLFPVLAIAIWISGNHLIQMKLMSAVGRLLMLDVAREHVFDHFWLGTGPGRFSWYYPQWQAQYFQQHPAPSLHFYLSAGESYVLFNEYLQVFEELGIVGLIVLAAGLIWFFSTTTSANKALLSTCKLVMIAILVVGLTSYPLHITPLIFLFFCCFLTAYILGDRKEDGTVVAGVAARIFRISGMLALSIFFMLSLVNAAAAFKWQCLRNRYLPEYGEQVKEYEKLMPLLKHDGKYLLDYGEVLLQNTAAHRRSVLLLEQCNKYFLTYRSAQALGIAYKQSLDYEKALAQYQYLSNLVPSRFSPRYEMAGLYLKMGDSARARQVAATIVSMPVKITSDEVKRIRMEMNALLKHQ